LCLLVCRACAASRAKRATEKRVRNSRGGRNAGVVDPSTLFTPILRLGEDGKPDPTLVAEVQERQRVSELPVWNPSLCVCRAGMQAALRQ
jgi:hypothetical protein